MLNSVALADTKSGFEICNCIGMKMLAAVVLVDPYTLVDVTYFLVFLVIKKLPDICYTWIPFTVLI